MLFLYNPTAGKGRVTADLAAVLDVFTKAGYLTTVYPTQGKADATRIAAELGGQFDRVVCSGGDGTLSETVSGLMQLDHPPVLGYIPFGSTNDCATTLRLPRDPVKAAQTASETGVPRPWDIGRLNGRPFVYVAAFGAFTEVSYDTPQDLKNTFGHLAYVMAGIASLPSITHYHLRIECDDQVLEDDFFYGMVCNTISVGGMKALPTDRVVLDDGRFELLLIPNPKTAVGLQNLIFALLNQDYTSGGVVFRHVSHLHLETDTELPWSLDGEYAPSVPEVDIVNRQAALRMLL